MPQAARPVLTVVTNEAPAPLPPPRRLQPWKIAGLRWLPDFIAKPVFGKSLAPDQQEWAQVQQALWTGDAPMDKVVDWMFENGPRHTKPLFEQALTRGIDTLDNPPAVLKEFFARIDTPPAWLDRELLEKGIEASPLSGRVSFFVLRDMALMGGYAYFNSMNQTLASSGALSKETGLRLGETGKWLSDVTERHGMDRFGPGFITTVRVRMVHALVRRHLRGKPGWEGEKWGLPINQIDMLATYLAFGPVSLVGARVFGVPFTLSDSKAIMHLWRYIGWLMGVDEQWLAITERDGWRKLYHTFLTHRLPDEKIKALGHALRDEPLNRVMPGADKYPLLAKLQRRFAYHQHLSNSALILTPIQRRQLGLSQWILPWYPLLSAPVRLGVLGYYKWRGGDTLARYLSASRVRQKALMEAYFAGREADIIRPGEGHPAHLQ